jgi:hypothetical protein
MRALTLTLAMALLLTSAACGKSGGYARPVRFRAGFKLWFQLQTNLTSDTSTAAALGVLDRAARAGYTGMMLNDGALQWFHSKRRPTHYLEHLNQVVAHANALGIEVVPQLFVFGSGTPMFGVTDPNLAEGLPVVGAPFTVAGDGKSLTFAPSYTGPLNGGFETFASGAFSSWTSVISGGAAGTTPIAQDTAIFHGGTASAKFTLGQSLVKSALLKQTLAVTPQRQYHVQFWLKTQGVPAQSALGGTFNVRLSDAGTGPRQSFYNPVIASTQNWTRYDYFFNSRSSSSLDLTVGFDYSGVPGTFWIDDLVVEETALVNVLHRTGAPIIVHGTGGQAGTTYVSGTDYDAITDPKVDQGDGSFDAYHTPPTVTLPAGTTLTPGQNVTIDFYAVAPTMGYQVGVCLTETAVQTFMTQNFAAISAALPSGTGYLLGYDEMRHINTCSLCAARGLTAGQLLAAHVQQSVDTIRKVQPDAPIYLWNDMFDPNQNAVNNYFYVGGDLANSWLGIPKDVTVLNWNLPFIQQSMSFFSKLGNPQIFAGYYDTGDGAGSAATELAGVQGVSGDAGFMYTTWNQDYTQLENYATGVISGWAASLPH